MQLSTLLAPEAVKFIAAPSSKKRLFQDICDVAAGAYGLCPDTAVEALQDRESLGPTGVGEGIALPHARIEELDSIVGVFVRLEKAIDFEAVDRQPVDLAFTLFAPVASGVDHLKALASVSRTMRDVAICAKLRSNTAPGTIHAILTESPASKAA